MDETRNETKREKTGRKTATKSIIESNETLGYFNDDTNDLINASEIRAIKITRPAKRGGWFDLLRIW